MQTYSNSRYVYQLISKPPRVTTSSATLINNILQPLSMVMSHAAVLFVLKCLIIFQFFHFIMTAKLQLPDIRKKNNTYKGLRPAFSMIDILTVSSL